MGARTPAQRLRALLLLAGVAACSRTGLDVEGETRLVTGAPRDGSMLLDAAAPREDAAVKTMDARAPSEPHEPTTPPPPRRCTPKPETCNGADDDCNGKVDDGIAAIPCPGGGSRYCVAGALTACPNRCDACIPGSERVCFHSYCTYWAVQACTADGKSFGTCRERTVPAECAAVANRYQESPELERCCIDNGYCCHDEFDLDHDGDRGEMLGTCDEVSCN